MNFFNLPRWSPDGRSILVVGSDKKGRQGVHQVDIRTGEVNPFALSNPDASIGYFSVSPDGKKIFYITGNRTTKSNHLLMRDLETAQEKELFRAAGNISIQNLAVSPDGKQLAFSSPKPGAGTIFAEVALKVISTAGGEPRELIRLKDPEKIAGYLGVVEWTPDGRYIIFGKSRYLESKGTYSKETTDLWRIPAQGGAPQPLGIAMELLRWMRFHPDGQRIAISAGKPGAEVWVMENFLPAAQNRRTSVSRR